MRARYECRSLLLRGSRSSLAEEKKITLDPCSAGATSNMANGISEWCGHSIINTLMYMDF